MTASNTLILGIGNTLLSDEGAGVHAVRMLAERLQDHDSVETMDGGTLSFALAEAMEESAQLIVIDAAQLDAGAGTTRVFEGEAMDAFVGGRRSVHEVFPPSDCRVYDMKGSFV